MEIALENQIDSVIFNNLSHALLLIDIDGLIVNVNEQYLTDLCFPNIAPDDIIGKSVFTNAAATLRIPGTLYKNLIESSDHHASSTYELFDDNKRVGRIYNVRKVTQIESDSYAKFIMFQHEDITKMRQMEEELAIKQRQLDEIQEIAQVGMWNLYIPTQLAEWSEQEYKLLGLDPEKDEAISYNFLERIHKDDKEKTIAALERPFIDGSPYEAEFRIVRDDGSTIYVTDRGKVIWDENGNAIRYVGTTLDITKRKLAELKLEESRTEYKNILDNMQDTYYRTDLNGIITRASKSVFDLLGYLPEEVKGKKITDLYVNASEREELKKQLVENNGRVHAFEARLICKDKSIIWVSTNAQYFCIDGEVKGIEGTVRNITEIKNYQSEIKKHHDHLEQLVKDRTHELEAFNYSVSHDLRAPLRRIDGFSAVLEEECFDQLSTDGKDYLTRIRSSVHAMGNLIDDMLRLSKINQTELNRKLVNLGELAEEILKHLKNDQSERNFAIDIESNLLCYADLSLIRIVMENLLSNACKFSSNREVTRIKIGKISEDIQLENEACSFYVKDNGVGFNQEYVSQIFDPFQRLHSNEEFEGSGIGLAIVQRIISKHNGKIWAESNDGHGATFYFSIPDDASDS